MKAGGTTSSAPLTDSFARWPNLRVVLLALFGATAGQAVVWYCGQFYALFFLTQTLKLEPQSANLLVAGALLLGTPFFIVFGRLSDRIGRKPIVLAGCLLAALTYFPLFGALTHFANPAIAEAQAASPVVVAADPATCSFQFDPVGKTMFASSCDIAVAQLAKAGVPYEKEPSPDGVASVASVRVGAVSVVAFEGAGLPADELAVMRDRVRQAARRGARLRRLSGRRGPGAGEPADGAR